MSYSNEQKREIIEGHYKSPCCKRSLLFGMLFAKGSLQDGKVVLYLSKQEYADFAGELVRELFGKTAEYMRPTNGGRRIGMVFESGSAAKYISEIEKNGAVVLKKCSSCLSSFLRGVFLAAGRVSDPEKRFSLDFTLGDRADAFAELLTQLSLEPLVSRKATGDIVYFRNSDMIEDFYGYVGFNKAVFEIIELKITNEARKVSASFMNCVTHNYNRMTSVANRCISIIQRLDELNLLSSLPDELEATARMRVQYPDLSLAALAARMSPAVSKSGMSHRLKKIEEIGERLLTLDPKS